MRKSSWVLLLILFVSAVLFVSCSPILTNHPSLEGNGEEAFLSVAPNKYGTYLAGRVAHMRRDFDAAVVYYKLAYAKDDTNSELIDKLYLLLASQGNIDEAAAYAKKAVESGSSNNFAAMLLAIKQMHDGQFTDAIKSLNNIKEPMYKALIAPLLNAWNYAGLNNPKQAYAELNKLGKDDQIAKLHRAMIADYLGQNREASEFYRAILEDKNAEVSVRTLEIITNFYVRTDQKEQAVALMKLTLNSPVLESLLSNLREGILKASSSEPPILTSPQVGAAEGLFIIASTFRLEDILDLAHMYTALSVYMNPEYSTARILMADIFSAREMYDEANTFYDSIDKTDIAYYAAQMKKVTNLLRQEDYKGAEILLKSLSDDYDDMQIYIRLGDILKHDNRFKEAIKYYDKALAKTANEQDAWPIYYAKGVALSQNGQWQKAEESLLKAYGIKKHYLVLNHLGYTWMRQNQKVEEAFEMIIDAYNQVPYDPSINDSLGFALYNLGYYAQALTYLEKAVDLYPSSAVISSHLGDAYWFAHRKNEARFQWKHALGMKDDSGEISRDELKEKIRSGIAHEPSLTYDKDKIEALIQRIKKPGSFRRMIVRQ